MSVIPLLAASGHDLPRRPRAQDDLRRLSDRAGPRRRGAALPLRGPRAPGRAAVCRARPDAARLHGRRQQHDRQRTRPGRVRRGHAPPRRAPVRRRRARLRRDRRARAGRAVPVRGARQQHRAPLRRDLRQRGARRRLLEGVLVAARVHRLPDRRQGPAQGRGAAVSLFGAVAGGLARHRAGRLRRQRGARRRPARQALAADGPRARRAAAAGDRDAQPLRPPDHRDPAAATTCGSTRSGASSSTRAST